MKLLLSLLLGVGSASAQFLSPECEAALGGIDIAALSKLLPNGAIEDFCPSDAAALSTVLDAAAVECGSILNLVPNLVPVLDIVQTLPCVQNDAGEYCWSRFVHLVPFQAFMDILGDLSNNAAAIVSYAMDFISSMTLEHLELVCSVDGGGCFNQMMAKIAFEVGQSDNAAVKTAFENYGAQLVGACDRDPNADDTDADNVDPNTNAANLGYCRLIVQEAFQITHDNLLGQVPPELTEFCNEGTGTLSYCTQVILAGVEGFATEETLARHSSWEEGLLKLCRAIEGAELEPTACPSLIVTATIGVNNLKNLNQLATMGETLVRAAASSFGFPREFITVDDTVETTYQPDDDTVEKGVKFGLTVNIPLAVAGGIEVQLGMLSEQLIAFALNSELILPSLEQVPAAFKIDPAERISIDLTNSDASVDKGGLDGCVAGGTTDPPGDDAGAGVAQVGLAAGVAFLVAM